MAKDIFYFSKSDRIAAIVLLSVILITVFIRTGMKPGGADIDAVPSDSLQWVPQPAVTRQTESFRERQTRDTVIRPSYNRLSSRRTVTSVSRDSVRTVRHTGKTAPLTALNLNNVDSAGLVSLPGIGPYYASRILNYREQLGGYVKVSQLMEVEGLPDSLMKWFILEDSVPFRMIKVNMESLSSLRRHPYLNFYQARAIIEFRKDRGKMKGPEQMSLLEEFSDQDLERLIPYLDFR